MSAVHAAIVSLPLRAREGQVQLCSAFPQERARQLVCRLATVSWTWQARGSRCLRNGLCSAVAIHPPAYHLDAPESVAHADDFLSLPSRIVADEDSRFGATHSAHRFGPHRDLTVTGKDRSCAAR